MSVSTASGRNRREPTTAAEASEIVDGLHAEYLKAEADWHAYDAEHDGSRPSRTDPNSPLYRLGVAASALINGIDRLEAHDFDAATPYQPVRSVALTSQAYATGGAQLATLTQRPRHPLTDSGNAERFADDHADDLLYIPGPGWHAWDGRRYRPDGNGETVRRAKVTARSIRDEARNIDNKERAEQVFKWALRSESKDRISATISLARAELPLLAEADELDADPWALNVHNGIVDLQTGELRSHDRKARCAKLAGAAYDPDARSESWDRFLEQTTGGDPELLAYLQRAVGYTACGVTDEEVILFAHGPAATGKTTFLEAVGAALGEYSRTADFCSFLTSRREAGGPSPDLARLAGARMAAASEASSGQTFNAGRLKSLTGGDRIVARQMYGNPFEFKPRFTLWLAANERPGISADDDGAWRRMRLLPFIHTVPPGKRDGNLKRRLTSDPDDLAAILAWTVQGALDWQAHGLGTCAAVEAATGTYREDEDPIAEFLAARCALDEDARTMGGELFESYVVWARRSGDEPVDNRAFARALRAHGVTSRRTKLGTRWQGIRLSAAGEQTEMPTPDRVTGDA